MYDNMTLQDFFPFDSTVLGMENLYSEIGNDSSLVNSPCVVARDKVLKKGNHFMLIEIPSKSNINIREIVLIDLFYYERDINLIVRDFKTDRVFRVNFCLECPEKHCTLFLVDLNYFSDRMDDRAIKDYCGCDTDKKQPLSKCNTKAADDLLEFEF
jgi:hypothetical protein